MIYSQVNKHQRHLKKKEYVSPFQKLLKHYWTYVDRQASHKVYWYMLVILAIPCVYMTLSILAMEQMIQHFEYFIGFSMLLFYTNVMVHVGGLKSRVYVPLFHLTTLLFVLIPLITYLITQS